jgi:hypothetical protein
MKLTQLAAQPQLIRLELDDEDVIAKYGESLEFWILDRQPLEDFIKMATLKTEDFGQLVAVVNAMILDEEGNTICRDGLTFPNAIMTKIIGKVVETLGK